VLLVDDRAVLGRISVLGIARRMPSDLEFKLRFAIRILLHAFLKGEFRELYVSSLTRHMPREVH